MHVDPHLAPRLMEVQIGFDCEALHLSSVLTRTDGRTDGRADGRRHSGLELLCVLVPRGTHFLRLLYIN